MKTGYYWFFLIAVILNGCQKETGNPTIDLTGSTDCKSLFKSEGEEGTQDCIEYVFSDNILTIKHVNAGFNCCPEEFIVNLAVNGDTLIITEREKESMCDCNCLFDLDYTLSDIARKTWWIRVKEQYVNPAEMDEIFFEANLRKDPEGSWCVKRTTYPWGQ